MIRTIDEFRYDLGRIESGNDYKNDKNPLGFKGKYQMGEAALVDAGYYKKKIKSYKDYNNDWSGEFLKGLHSINDFLNSPQAQEDALNEYKKKQWGYLKPVYKYLGKEVNGIRVTPSGMLAGAHLGGDGNVRIYLNSNGKNDAYDGAKYVSEYMRDFQDYDVTEWTGPRYRPDGRILSDEELAQFESEQKQPEKIEGKIGKIQEKQEPQKSKFSKTKQKRQLSPEELEKSVDKAILRIFLGTIIYGLHLLGAKNGNIEDSKITLIKVLKMVAKNNNMTLSDLVDYIYNKIIELDTYEQNKYMMKYLNQVPTQQNLKSQIGKPLNMNFANLIRQSQALAPQTLAPQELQFNIPQTALKNPSLKYKYWKKGGSENNMQLQNEKMPSLYQGSSAKPQKISQNSGQSILNATNNAPIKEVKYKNLPEFKPMNIPLENNPIFNFGSTNYTRGNPAIINNGESFDMNGVLKLSMKILEQYLSGKTGQGSVKTQPQQYYEFIPSDY